MPETGTEQSSTPRRHRPALWVVAAGVVLLALGVWWTRGDASAPRAVDPAGSPSVSPSMDTTAAATPAKWVPGAPVRLKVPSLGIKAPVVPVKAPNRTLVPPNDASQLGWWADGARPGARRGSALITGHSVHDGHGALQDLESIGKGERIVVRTKKSSITYVVQRVRVFHKGTVAEEAEQLFSQTAPGRLVLVTCEDWDGTRYLSNVVVTAVPA